MHRRSAAHRWQRAALNDVTTPDAGYVEPMTRDTPAPSTDFRISKRDAALTRAASLDKIADAGGTALYDADQYRRAAGRARSFAAWVQSMIDAHPPTTTPGM